MSLILALPSKGRLKDQCLDWFGARGLAIERAGADRTYAAEARGADGLAIVLMAAAEIPGALLAGRAHLGVTGQDLLREMLPAGGPVAELAALGFGRADLVLAVPESWADVPAVGELDRAAADFRARHGRPLRIATKYPRLLRDFLRGHGVADWRIVASEGATEAAVKNGTAEAIADITSTGETLRANRLRVPEGGLILASEAVLARSGAATWDAAATEVLAALAAQVGLPAPAP
jgi:ATP phosphoribosyltransferase